MQPREMIILSQGWQSLGCGRGSNPLQKVIILRGNSHSYGNTAIGVPITRMNSCHESMGESVTSMGPLNPGPWLHCTFNKCKHFLMSHKLLAITIRILYLVLEYIYIIDIWQSLNKPNFVSLKIGVTMFYFLFFYFFNLFLFLFFVFCLFVKL